MKNVEKKSDNKKKRRREEGMKGEGKGWREGQAEREKVGSKNVCA